METEENEIKIFEEVPDLNNEIKRKCCFLHKVKVKLVKLFVKLFTYVFRISKRMKLVHVITYVARFISNCKANKVKLKDILNATEIKSKEILIKLLQKESFNEEYTLLLNNEEIKNGRVKELLPFLDKN